MTAPRLCCEHSSAEQPQPITPYKPRFGGTRVPSPSCSSRPQEVLLGHGLQSPPEAGLPPLPRCTQNKAAATADALFPRRQHEASTDLNRTKEMERKEEMEARKAQEDATPTGLGWDSITPGHCRTPQWHFAGSHPHVQIHTHSHCSHLLLTESRSPGGTAPLSLTASLTQGSNANWYPSLPLRSQQLRFTLFSALQRGQSPCFNPPEHQKQSRQCQLFADGGKSFFATILVN